MDCISVARVRSIGCIAMYRFWRNSQIVLWICELMRLYMTIIRSFSGVLCGGTMILKAYQATQGQITKNKAYYQHFKAILETPKCMIRPPLHNSQQLILYIAMNFDRIQKLRSQRTIESIKSQQTNPQVKSKEVFSINNRKQATSGTMEIKNIQYDKGSTNSTQSHSQSVTLRDFLHLTSKVSVKQSPSKKINRSSVQYKKTQPSRSTSQQRKRTQPPTEKQQTSKKEIFEIVKKDINRDLTHIKEVAQALQGKFQEGIQCLKLSNAQMIEIYNFRKRIRENVVKEMNALDEMIGNIIFSQRRPQEDCNMPVIFEEEEQRRVENSAPLTHDDEVSKEREYSKERTRSFEY